MPLLSVYSEKVGGGFATWMVPTCQRHRASIFMWQLEVAGLGSVVCLRLGAFNLFALLWWGPCWFRFDLLCVVGGRGRLECGAQWQGLGQPRGKIGATSHPCASVSSAVRWG